MKKAQDLDQLEEYYKIFLKKEKKINRMKGVSFGAVVTLVPFGLIPLLMGDQVIWWGSLMGCAVIIIAILKPLWLRPFFQKLEYCAERLFHGLGVLSLTLVFFLIFTVIRLILAVIRWRPRKKTAHGAIQHVIKRPINRLEKPY